MHMVYMDHLVFISLLLAIKIVSSCTGSLISLMTDSIDQCIDNNFTSVVGQRFSSFLKTEDIFIVSWSCLAWPAVLVLPAKKLMTEPSFKHASPDRSKMRSRVIITSILIRREVILLGTNCYRTNAKGPMCK